MHPDGGCQGARETVLGCIGQTGEASCDPGVPGSPTCLATTAADGGHQAFYVPTSWSPNTVSALAAGPCAELGAALQADVCP
jgi:hypothetical protein